MKVNLKDKTTRSGVLHNMMYSKGFGWNILSRIVKDLGVEVLFQFGVTKQRLNRMLDKGLLGGELDLLLGIRGARGNFEIKYIKEREYKILTSTINVFTEYFYLKPVMMLALQPSFAGRHIATLKKGSIYKDIIFDGDKRPIIDRTLFYDAFIYYIIELDKLYSINNEAVIKICTENLAYTHSSAWRIFFNWFSYMKLDTHLASYQTIIAKKPRGFEPLQKIAQYIRAVHKDNGISNVQAYNKSMTGPIIKEKFHHRFVNFAAHGKLYNPLLQSMRQNFYEASISSPPLGLSKK